MIIETALLVASVLSNIVSFIKDANTASKESKELWERVKSVFSNDPAIDDLENKPDDKDTQDVISAILKKKFNENEHLKNQFIDIIEKIKLDHNTNMSASILGNANVTVLGSSAVSITTKSKDSE